MGLRRSMAHQNPWTASQSSAPISNPTCSYDFTSRFYENEFPEWRWPFFCSRRKRKRERENSSALIKCWSAQGLRRTSGMLLHCGYFVSFGSGCFLTWGYIGFGIWIETGAWLCGSELPRWRYFSSSIYEE